MKHICYYCHIPLEPTSIWINDIPGANNIETHVCNKHEYPITYGLFVNNKEIRWYAMVIDFPNQVSFHVDPLLSKVPYLRFGKPNTTDGTIHKLDMNPLSLPINDLIEYCNKFINLKVFL